MLKKILFAFFILLIITSTSIYAKTGNSRIFESLFKEWTTAFNQKDIVKSCGLFSKQVVADYQGAPHKNYQRICEGFKHIFSDKNKRYHYEFKLHHVYRSQDLAVVRITWYLRIYENDKLQSLTQDEGIDILEKNKENKWQIVNYIAYGEKIN